MIFMSQSGLATPEREADWDRWYIDHLAIMLTVPGVRSTQRFKCSTPGHPPSLAMYSITTAAVFQDPYYLRVRGMGEWLPLIDRRWYRRNLFDGAAIAPAVGSRQVLLVRDSDMPGAAPEGARVLWLRSVGLDRSTAYRGIAVVDAMDEDATPPGYTVYRPVTEHLTSPC